MRAETNSRSPAQRQLRAVAPTPKFLSVTLFYVLCYTAPLSLAAAPSTQVAVRKASPEELQAARRTAMAVLNDARKLAPDFGGGTGRGSTPDNNSAADCYILIARLQTAAGDMAAARDTLLLASQERSSRGVRQPAVTGALALAEARLGNFEEAKKVAARIETTFDRFARANVLSQIARIQITSGDVAGGGSTFELSKRAVTEPDGDSFTKFTKNSLLLKMQCEFAQALASVGDATEAKRMLKDATQYVSASEKNVEALVTLAAGWEKVGDSSQAKSTFSEAMQAAAGNEFDGQPFVSAQIEAGDIEGAKQTADQVLASKATSQFLQALDALADSGHAQVAKALLKEAIAKKRLGDVEEEEILETQLKCHDLAGAGDTVAAMKDQSSKPRALIELAEAQTAGGDAVVAGRVLAAAKQAVAKSTDPHDFVLIAQAQAMVGDIAAAKQTTAKLTKPGDRCYALSDIAAAYAKAGDMKMAREDFESALHAAYPDAEEARQRPQNFDEDMRRHANCWSRDMRVRYIVQVRAQSGDLEGARDTIVFITLVSERAAAHCDIALALMKAGDPHGANDEFATARSVANENEQPIFYSEQDRFSALIKIAKRQLRCFGLLADDEQDDGE